MSKLKKAYKDLIALQATGKSTVHAVNQVLCINYYALYSVKALQSAKTNNLRWLDEASTKSKIMAIENRLKLINSALTDIHNIKS